MGYLLCVLMEITSHFSHLYPSFLVKTHGGGGRAEGRGSIRAQSQDVCRSGQCFCISRSCSSCPSLSLFRVFLSAVSSFGLLSVCIVGTSVLLCVLQRLRRGFVLPVSSFA